MVNCKILIIFLLLSKSKFSSKLIIQERGDGFRIGKEKIYTRRQNNSFWEILKKFLIKRRVKNVMVVETLRDRLG